MWAGGAWRIAAWTPAARVLPRARGERGDVRARARRVRARALDIGARRRWFDARPDLRQGRAEGRVRASLRPLRYGAWSRRRDRSNDRARGSRSRVRSP